jgi:hypothetical protein
MGCGIVPAGIEALQPRAIRLQPGAASRSTSSRSSVMVVAVM